jgi:hypothetical protein
MKEGDTSEQVIQNPKKSPKEMIKVEAVEEWLHPIIFQIIPANIPSNKFVI